MAKAKRQIDKQKTIEPPKIPMFGKFGRPSAFSGGNQTGHKSFVPKSTRITQHKGGS